MVSMFYQYQNILLGPFGFFFYYGGLSAVRHYVFTDLISTHSGGMIKKSPKAPGLVRFTLIRNAKHMHDLTDGVL